MIKNLIRLANLLDKKNEFELANKIDNIIEKTSSNIIKFPGKEKELPPGWLIISDGFAKSKIYNNYDEALTKALILAGLEFGHEANASNVDPWEIINQLLITKGISIEKF